MNGMAAPLLAVLVNGWLAGSILLLLALVLDRRTVLPARARHMVVLACVVSTLPLALGAGAGWGGEAVRTATAGRVVQEVEIAVGPGSPAAGWIGPIWVAVAGVLLVREVVGHTRLRRVRHAWRPADPAERSAVGWPRGLPLSTGPGGAPLALGLLRPEVYLPERSFLELSPVGLRAVGAHERAHARWRDPATWAVARVVRIVLWPVLPLGLLERRLHRAAEEAADAAATAAAGREARAEYCRTLLVVAGWVSTRAVRGRIPAMAVRGLEGRLRAVLRPGPPGRRRGVAAAAGTLATLALLGALPWARPAAVPGEPTSPLTGSVERQGVLDLLRKTRVAVSEEGDDPIRIVVPGRDERVQRLRQVVVEEGPP